jgi:cation transport regulator
MPYSDIKRLPSGINRLLPTHAQSIFMKAFNNAWDEYKNSGSRRDDDDRETVARKVAWTAVKKKYRKDDDGHWRSNASA